MFFSFSAEVIGRSTFGFSFAYFVVDGTGTLYPRVTIHKNVPHKMSLPDTHAWSNNRPDLNIFLLRILPYY